MIFEFKDKYSDLVFDVTIDGKYSASKTIKLPENQVTFTVECNPTYLSYIFRWYENDDENREKVLSETDTLTREHLGQGTHQYTATVTYGTKVKEIFASVTVNSGMKFL